MDITTNKYFCDVRNNWYEYGIRTFILYGLAVLTSLTLAISAVLFYNKQYATPATDKNNNYFPLSHSFASSYPAGQIYKPCQSSPKQSQISQGDCKDGCTGEDLPGTAAITWLVLECNEAENFVYAEFAQGLVQGVNGGLVIEIVKRDWSF